MPYTELQTQYLGFTGAPGYTRWRFWGSLDNTQTAAVATRVKTFLGSLTNYMSSGMKWTFNPEAGRYADDGSLSDVISGWTVPSDTSGIGSGAMVGGTGIIVNWTTSTVHGGKKVRGKTYLVPLLASAFGADGMVIGAVRTAIQTAATTLVGGIPELVISSQHADGGAAGPLTVKVTSASVPLLPCVLHSRKV